MIRCPKCGTEYDGAERFCPKDGTRLGTGEAKLPHIPSIQPDADPLINSIIQGRYKVMEQIGEGGMGVVYVAEHVEIEKKVALKVLRDDFSKRPEVVARFRQEARSASRIGNAHIVDVTDFGQLDNGGVFFVMEHLQGKGLSDVIRTEVIPVERAIRIVLQITKALKAAHKLGIVHRDLKPENIFLVENDEEKDFVKILDFGIAKISDRDSEGQRLTKTGMIFGTPEYMSPEQASGKPLDHRVDIYALGCIMFEMFTGVVPYEGETFMAVLTQHMFEPVPDIEEINPETDANEAVKTVVYRAMAKDKEERYPDMESLAVDLERAMHGIAPAPLVGNEISSEITYRPTLKTHADDNEMKWTPEVTIVGTGGSGRTGMIVAILVVVVLSAALTGAYLKGFLRFGAQDTSKNVDESVLVASPGVSPTVIKKDTQGTEETDSGRENENDSVGDDISSQQLKEGIVEKKKHISVSVKTEPAGATVFVEGMGQVCSDAPCEIELEEGVSYNLKAKLNGREAGVGFTPSEQNSEVKFELSKKIRSDRKRTRHKEKETKEKKPSGSGSDLKIPDIFKNN